MIKLRALRMPPGSSTLGLNEIEVIDASQQNVALLSRGARILATTDSTVTYDLSDNWILHYDLGTKWVRVGLSDGGTIEDTWMGMMS